MTFSTGGRPKMATTEKQTLCCLRRIGGKATSKALIPLQDATEVTVGRGLDCTVRITGPMFSRKHAILRKEDGNWSVTDNKSTNGVFVNSTQLEPNVPVVLKEGDELQIGVPTKPDEPAEFVWRFYTALKVKKFRPTTSEVAKRPHSDKDSPTSTETPAALKRLCPNNPPEVSPTAEYKKKLKEVQKESEEKLKEHQRLLEEMKKELEEKEKAQELMKEKLKEKEEQLKKEVEQKKAEHEVEQERIKEELQQKYEREIKEQEENLRKKLVEERDKLEETREDLELQLSEQMAKEIHERDLKLQHQLEEQKTRLNAIIQEKDAKQKMLESQLADSKTAQETAKEANALEAKEDVLRNFADLMETELQCSICSELYVQATSLSCSHSFCAYCIHQWMAVKKECPVCRAKITSHLRSIALDNYIDRMIEHFTDEMKESRKEVIASRKEEEAKREADKLAAAKAREAAASTSRRGGRRRGRARGRAGTTRGRGGNTRAASPPPRATRGSVIDLTSPARATVGAAAGRVVISSSSDSDSNEGSHDDDSSQDSNLEFPPSDNPNTDDSEDSNQSGFGYFGGYGRCFNCGRRGHWANGCPF